MSPVIFWLLLMDMVMEPGGDGFFGIINHPPPPPAPDDVIIIELYPLLWGGTDELHWGSSDRLVYD